MNTGKKLAISAVMGILGAAATFGTVQHAAKAAENSATGDNLNEKYGCGNHDGGKCGAMLTNEKSMP